MKWKGYNVEMAQSAHKLWNLEKWIGKAIVLQIIGQLKQQWAFLLEDGRHQFGGRQCGGGLHRATLLRELGHESTAEK